MRCLSRIARIAPAAFVALAAAVQISVAQNIGSISQAVNSAAPYNSVYFGMYPQIYLNTVLEAMDHKPMPETPGAPFVIAESDNQVLNGGALSFGKSPRRQATIITVGPLAWQAVSNGAEGILMFTDQNIDVVPYNEPSMNATWDGTWKNSSIRQWITDQVLLGHSGDTIPPVYRGALTSYPPATVGQFNDLIGVVFPHSALPAPPAGMVTAKWNATGGAARKDYFSPAERSAIVRSRLTNPSLGGNVDNVDTEDYIFLPSLDVVEAVYPAGASRRSVNTRYTMSYVNTTSAPADDDWITRSHNNSPFQGYITQITRTTGAKDAASVNTRKPVRLALNLDRDRVLMVSQSKPAGTSLSFTPAVFTPATTLKLTLIDDVTLTPFTATSTTAPLNGYITVAGSLTLNCTGGTGGTGAFISCLLEDRDGIRYYTKALPSTGAPISAILDFTGVQPGTYTLKVFNEITNTTDAPDLATAPSVFEINLPGTPVIAPVIDPSPLANGFTGRTYSDTVRLSTAGSPLPGFTLTAGALPPDLKLDGATGRISGALTTTSAGSYTFTVRAYNPAGASEHQFTIAVSTIVPPEIATTQDSLIQDNANEGQLTIPYSYRFKLKPGTGLPSVKFYRTAGNLPTGFVLDDDGTLHGTPVTVETQNFTICAETEGMFDYDSYSISIFASSPTSPILPVFVTTDLGASASVKENTPLAAVVIQITGSQYVDVQYDPASFPTGITFDPSTRRILGTPIQGTAGTYGLKMWAKNPATRPTLPSGPDSVGIVYPLTVLPANVPMIVTPPVLPPAAVGLPYKVKIDTDKPGTLTVSAGMLPPTGFMLNPQDEIEGTPTSPGTYKFTIKATNAEGWSSREFTLVVQQASPPPLVSSFTLPDGAVGEAYVGATLTATGSPSSWSWTGAPPGLQLSSSGIISGIPVTAGTYHVTVTASNAWGTSPAQTGTLIINPPPPAAQPLFMTGLDDGIENVPYSARVYAYTVPDMQWTLTGGTMPPGLKFEDGIISGTPLGGEGRYSLTVRVSSAGGFFPPQTRTLTLWILSFYEELRSRRITLPPVPGATLSPEPGTYYIKSGGDFVFTLTPNGSRPFTPEVTTSRVLVHDSIGVSVSPNADSLSYTVTIHNVHEEVYINVTPAAIRHVDAATRAWSTGRSLCISTPVALTARIYDLSGRLLKTVFAPAGRTEIAVMSAGVYLVELDSGFAFKVSIR
jgi:hypothetical protein